MDFYVIKYFSKLKKNRGKTVKRVNDTFIKPILIV